MYITKTKNKQSYAIFYTQIIFNKNTVCKFKLDDKKELPPACQINPFQTNVPFLYPLRTSENLRFHGGMGVEHWLEMG